MVESGGLENRWARKGLLGSNPSFSVFSLRHFFAFVIDLCRTKRIEVVNVGLCLLNDKSKFFSLVLQRSIIFLRKRSLDNDNSCGILSVTI